MTPDVAARNNASWCDAVCAANGISTSRTDKLWVSATRSPPFYPDVVTLRPDVTAAEVLDGIEASVGASVKDSFSTLDLSGDGFRVLFDAQWLHWPATAGDTSDPIAWRVVSSPAALAVWVRAHPDHPPFPPSLLDDPRVTMLRTEQAGAVLFEAERAVGVTNVFATGGVAENDWRSLRDECQRRSSGVPVVGYESGADLTTATSAGARPVGPLRVWVRD